MAKELKTLRRVVTTNDADGRSGVLWDSNAPNASTRPTGSRFTEFWTVNEAPGTIIGAHDESEHEFSISPPEGGFHFRIAQTPPKNPEGLDDDSTQRNRDEKNASGVTERREDGPHWNMHRTPSVDYAFCTDGERTLILEDFEHVIHKGETVIQLANWHSWSNRSDEISSMAYLMISGEFPEKRPCGRV